MFESCCQGCLEVLVLQPYTCKVKCFLQWAKLCRTSSGKTALFINLDETCMKLNYGRQKGLLVRKLPPGKKHRKEQVSSSEEKASVSFLAFLTHVPEIQPLLPQVILGNKHRLTCKTLKELAPQQPANFHIWREDSSWVNHKVMRRILSLLAKKLADHLATYEVILVLDVAKSHFHTSIFAHAARLGIRLLYVPACLTYLLQPADTHLFSRLKSALRKKWLEIRVQNGPSGVTTTAWLLAVMTTVARILCSVKWQCAFEAAGLLGEGKLSRRVLQEVGWEAPVAVPAEVLSAEQVKLVFPKRSKVQRDSVFSWALPKAKAKVKAKAHAKAASNASSSADAGPISGRTRKKSAASSS